MREQAVHRALDHAEHRVEVLRAAVVGIRQIRAAAVRVERAQQRHPLARCARTEHMALMGAVHAHEEVVRRRSAEVRRAELPRGSDDWVPRPRQDTHRTRVGRLPFVKTMCARGVDREPLEEPRLRRPGPEHAFRSRASANIPRADKDHAVQSRL